MLGLARRNVRIGIISDTHGYVDPALPELFAGVEHILHAGDVGGESVLIELERIAPVTAVRGNMDGPMCSLKHTEVVELAGRKFLVQHIVKPHSGTDELGQLFGQVRPDVVVFGHTHHAFCEYVGGILFVNPGYAGRPKSTWNRTVAILVAGVHRIDARLISLDSG